MTRLTTTAAILAFAGGCGRPPTAEVSGSVTLDGRPLPGASVQLVPASDVNLGTLAAGTDAGGRFAVARDAAGLPARPGAYVVLVSKPVAGASMAEARDELPERYRDRTRTPFAADLTPGPNALPPFALSSQSDPPLGTKPGGAK